MSTANLEALYGPAKIIWKSPRNAFGTTETVSMCGDYALKERHQKALLSVSAEYLPDKGKHGAWIAVERSLDEAKAACARHRQRLHSENTRRAA